MTPKQFKKQMEIICSSSKPEQVLRPALDLITEELGKGMPAYLAGLAVFLDKLKALGPAIEAMWTYEGDNVINMFDRPKRKPVK